MPSKKRSDRVAPGVPTGIMGQGIGGSAYKQPTDEELRRHELFNLTRDMLLTTIGAAGGAPANEQQAREVVRLARAVQSEVDKPTARPERTNVEVRDGSNVGAEPVELDDTSF